MMRQMNMMLTFIWFFNLLLNFKKVLSCFALRRTVAFAFSVLSTHTKIGLWSRSNFEDTSIKSFDRAFLVCFPWILVHASKNDFSFHSAVITWAVYEEYEDPLRSVQTSVVAATAVVNESSPFAGASTSFSIRISSASTVLLLYCALARSNCIHERSEASIVNKREWSQIYNYPLCTFFHQYALWFTRLWVFCRWKRESARSHYCVFVASSLFITDWIIVKRMLRA